MSYITEKTCERSTKYIKNIDKEKMDEYCKSDSANAEFSQTRYKRVLDTLVQPYHAKTQSERFYAEEWINVCEKNQDGLSIPCNLYDNMKHIPYCYPTRRIDSNTGKIALELTDEQLEQICGRKITRSIDVPHDIILTIDFGKELLRNGYQRVKYAYKEDFTIREKNLSSETLYLWKRWMDRYGPRHKIVLNGLDYNTYTDPRSIQKSTTDYRFNYIKWKNSTVKNKKYYSGAVEWLLKGGDLAYLWLQSDIVSKKISEKYRDL
jgi:hypothetical protein